MYFKKAKFIFIRSLQLYIGKYMKDIKCFNDTEGLKCIKEQKNSKVLLEHVIR